MPSSLEFLAGLTRTANDWSRLAIAWHVFIAALLIALLLGWRPSRRLAGILLVLPLLSVSVLAWGSRNPFNGIVFGVAALVLVILALRMPSGRVQLGSGWLAALGGLLVAFGWVYPHFLETGPWTTYLYAAPLGLVPCPTLSVVIGLALMLGELDSRAWSIVLGATGVLYGLVGAFRLGVMIDLVLLAGAIVTVAAAAGLGRIRPRAGAQALQH